MPRDNKFKQYHLPIRESIFDHPAYDDEAIKKMALGDLDRDMYASRGNIFAKARRKNASGSPVKHWSLQGSDESIGLFGGDGSNGDLLIRSGTTTLDLGSAPFYIRNYNRIEISGTGSLAFSNPNNNGTIILLKSRFDCILTSTATALIDCNSLGGAAGPAPGINTPGLDGRNAIGTTNEIDAGNGGGVGQSGAGTTGASGSGGTPVLYALNISGKAIKIAPGSGSGSGGGGAAGSGGNGGAGAIAGGALNIECGGRLNFTGTIRANGANGSNGTNATSGGGGGGGGGAAGGCIAIVYNNLLANTGTLTTNGGNGGNGGNGADDGAGSKSGGGGAGGGANRFSGGAGGTGTTTTGNNGSTGSGTGGGTGGTGGALGGNSGGGGGGGGGSGGDSYVVSNTEFS